MPFAGVDAEVVPTAVFEDVGDMDVVLVSIAKGAAVVAEDGEGVLMRVAAMHDGDGKAELGGADEGFDL